jgi:hypothetical protein
MYSGLERIVDVSLVTFLNNIQVFRPTRTVGNHDIFQSIELHDGQNWNLVLSQYGVPEDIPFFVNFYVGLRPLHFETRFSLNVTITLDIAYHLRIFQTQSFVT